MKILVINGPNINMLGIREPGIYGKNSFADLLTLLEQTAQEEGLTVHQYQSNHEGDLVDKIQSAYGNYDGIVKTLVVKKQYIGSPFTLIRSLKSTRCGEVNSPTLYPAACSTDAKVCEHEPFPLVPAM